MVLANVKGEPDVILPVAGQADMLDLGRVELDADLAGDALTGVLTEDHEHVVLGRSQVGADLELDAGALGLLGVAGPGEDEDGEDQSGQDGVDELAGGGHGSSRNDVSG